MRTLIFSLLFLSMYKVQAQSQLAIYRSGFDRVLVVNKNYYSVTVTVGGYQKYLIPRYGSMNLSFTLNDNNVRNTPFIVTYDNDCYQMDALICSNIAERERARKNNRAMIIGLASQFFNERVS